jgi:hypothetical protein
MTESEAVEKLEAHIECESKRSSIEGCKEGCIDCELAYLQGTSKEHIESVKIAIQALEKQIGQTNADRIRNMSDEELAEFLCKVKSDYQWMEHEFPSEEEQGEWEDWLQSE